VDPVTALLLVGGVIFAAMFLGKKPVTPTNTRTAAGSTLNQTQQAPPNNNNNTTALEVAAISAGGAIVGDVLDNLFDG
jgi:hypothetical protein